MIRIILPLVCAALGLAAVSCGQSGDPFATAEAPASPHAPPHGAASAAMASPPNSPHAREASSPPATNQTSAAATQSPAATSDSMPSDQAAQDELPSLDETSPPATAQVASASAAEPTPDEPTTTQSERRASTLIGMPVVSLDGSPLGDVRDIVFDQQGRATHLVIAYGSAPDASSGDLTDAAKPALNPDGKLTAMPWDAAAASIKDGRMVLDGTKLRGAPSFTPQAWPNLENPGWNGTADAYWRKAVRAAIAAHPGAPIDSTTRQRGRRARDDE